MEDRARFLSNMKEQEHFGKEPWEEVTSDLTSQIINFFQYYKTIWGNLKKNGLPLFQGHSTKTTFYWSSTQCWWSITCLHIFIASKWSCRKVMFSVHSVILFTDRDHNPQPCRCSPPWTCSDLFNLDLTVEGLLPDMFKLVHYESYTPGKRTVGSLLECILVFCSFCHDLYVPSAVYVRWMCSHWSVRRAQVASSLRRGN